MSTPLWAVFLVIFATVISAFGTIYLKRSSSQLSAKIIFNINFLFGIFLYGVSSIIFLIALKHGDLSILYPLVATSYVWVGILSPEMLGEKMTLLKWVGLFLILIGVSLLGLGT